MSSPKEFAFRFTHVHRGRRAGAPPNAAPAQAAECTRDDRSWAGGFTACGVFAPRQLPSVSTLPSAPETTFWKP